MTLDAAIDLTQRLMGLAFLLSSLEHLRAPGYERRLFALRIPFCMALMVGVGSPWALLPLLAVAILALRRFRGPYNGGADRMGILMLLCVSAAAFASNERLKEVALGYLALQLVLSYALAGWVKILNPDWRTGRALRDLFAFSAYPVSASLRALADQPRLLRAMSWSTLAFELLFPLALLSEPTLWAALGVAFGFHLVNACVFGLNRFLWIWLAAYPSVLWLQGRVMSGG